MLRVEIKCDNHQTMPLSLPQSKERVEMPRHATTHSSKFLLTQGDHLTNNDSFIAAQMNVSGKDVKELLRLKKKQIKAMENAAAARAVMEKWEDELHSQNCEKMTVPDLDCLLLWYGVWNKAEKLSKSEKVGRLIIALSSKGDPPAVEEWTADDAARLLSLQENKITINDTALGRKRVLFEQQMVAASITMSDEQ
jgi:hypothetical protein